MELMVRLFKEPLRTRKPPHDLRGALYRALGRGMAACTRWRTQSHSRAFQHLEAAGDLNLRVLMQIPEENLDAAIQMGLRAALATTGCASAASSSSRTARWAPAPR